MGHELLYFADPMCSWCWGFAPVIERINRDYGEHYPLRVFAGGLAQGSTQPLTESGKQQIAEHWRHVEVESGQSFDHDFFQREAFVYNSELSCQAMVAVREASLNVIFFLTALHEAFYVNNRDITLSETLVAIACECGLEGDSFLSQLMAQATIESTQSDFELTKKLGIQGFPTLLGMADNQITVLTMGYQDYEATRSNIETWLRK